MLARSRQMARAATTLDNLSNSGTIQATGANGEAISAVTISNLTNSGTISATLFGIDASVPNANANSGTIEATGANGAAIFANTITVNNPASAIIRASGTGSTLGMF